MNNRDKNKYYLCKCLNCESIIIDQNPQVNATLHNLTGNELEMEKIKGEEEGEYFWGCPKCKTDAYLIDI
ncbi:MAG TPA: hypothetical protein VIK84_05725 [Haloplasmataceae bacterium]